MQASFPRSLALRWQAIDEDVRRRAGAVLLTLLIELLIMIAILTLGATRTMRRAPGGDLSAFTLSPAPATEPEAETEAATSPARAVPPPVPPQPFPAPNRVQAPPPDPYVPDPFVKVTRDEYRALDIGTFARVEGNEGANAGAPSAARTYGPGQGPGGEPIYDVAWVREPTDAELRPYLAEAKRVPKGAWAEIACRMIDHYHVENCRQLGESPAGSGVARALRLASWQFLVRPPRVGDRVQLGTWVRIRFDFRDPPAAADGPVLPGASEAE